MKNVIIFFIMLLLNNNCHALKIIRDEESEKFILRAINPILKAANIDVETFKLYIVDNKSINAFTMGGNKIFINSGLITNFDDINVLQGVVAHEIGHLLANHITLSKTNYNELEKISALGNVLGIIGGSIIGSGEIATAAIVTNNYITSTSFFSYSREFENQADNIALKLLRDSNISNDGLQQILIKLNKYGNYSSDLDAFNTHPSSITRINNIKQFNLSNNIKLVEDKLLQNEYERIVIKLKAFTLKLSSLKNEYQNYNKKYISYIKAILLYREGKTQEAIQSLDNFLNDNNKDPYLYELKGQILLEGGQLNEAAKAYQQALDLLPTSPIFQLQYAICLVNQSNNNNSKILLYKARDLIEKASLYEKENAVLLHYLAMIYGKLELIADADLVMAEKFMLLNDNKKALFFAKKALSQKNKLSSNAKLLRINDLLNTLEINKYKK